MSAILEVRDLQVVRGAREVVSVPALAIEEGETLVVLGPNGAGKTTLLLALARLLDATGELRFRGELVGDALAYRRRVAVVFQRPLLLDRSVRENVELGLSLRGAAASERRASAAEGLGRLGIADLSDRSALRLSGGEAQRVSLARALAVRPEILFLDEPFSALDAPTRESLVADLARVVSDEGLTTVLVTHDRDEALTLGHRVAVLLGGALRQVGPAESVFAAPADEEVAQFVGVENVLPAVVESASGELTLLRVGEQVVEVTSLPPPGDATVLLCVRPDDVLLARGASATSARNAFAARIVRLEPIGRRMRVRLDCGFPLVAHVTVRSARELELREGDRVTASFKATLPHLLPRHRPS